MKVCTRCKIEKEDNEFWKANNKSGLQNFCKKCMAEKGTEYRRKKGIKPLHKRSSIDELPTHKICTRCKIDKPREDFRLRLRGCVEINSTCRLCDAEVARIYYASKKNDETFKEKNRKRAREYKDKNFDKVKNGRKLPEYAKKHAALNKKHYHKVKEFISAKMKIKRQTPEYKAYVKAYREKRKAIIQEQEKITKRRYHEKNRDGITDTYALNLLRTQGNGTREELLQQPELIQEKKKQVAISRIKNVLRKIEKDE